MNYIDFLIHTANTANVRRHFPEILSDYVADMPQLQGIPGSDEFPRVPPIALPALASINDSYPRNVVENFLFYRDTTVIDKTIQKHWFDLTAGPINSPVGAALLFAPVDAPPYHLMFAYMIENTRIFQIFEKLIYMYMNDEELGLASASNIDHQRAFQWILNTENLYFKHLSNNSFRNTTSNVRSDQESVRRNAYYRLFGMDLAFEHSSNMGYTKAKTANNGFVVLFEQFLIEVWQAYINSRNSSGANTTDYQKIIDMVTKLREILLARRGATGRISLAEYRFMNLSREEYASVGLFNWLFYIISYDSPLVTFLGCQANTASERLIKIGKKVQIEAHSKSQALFDLSVPTATVLRSIEYGLFEVPNWLQQSIESQTPSGMGIATPQQSAALIDLLSIINNWEKATGHIIKNPSANIQGSVKIQQNGMPKPVLN
jgi:hypothetical protein